MAISDSIKANKGLCLVSTMIILLQLRSVYYCVISMNLKDTWDYFFGFYAMSIVFQMYKGGITLNCTVIC